MKLVFFLYAIMLVSSCKSTMNAPSETTLTLAQFCVTQIDSLTYKQAVVINGEISAMKSILLVKKKLQRCSDKITIGKCYMLRLKNLQTTSEFINVGYRLGEYDVYEDGKKVFPIDTPVYSTLDLSGLCIVVHDR